MSDSHDAHGHHGENVYPYTPHHFHSSKQHLESGKMGVWLFLVTEILFFAGLFCAYTIYRAQHPEVFYWAHFFLDTQMGAINTMVLIFSSFTAAWAVRNAQMGDKGKLKTNIWLTVICACIFMCVKYVEYSHKFHIGIFPAGHFDPQHYVWEEDSFKKKHPEAALAADRIIKGLEERKAKVAAVRDEVIREGEALALIPVGDEVDAAPAAAPKAEAAPAAEKSDAPADEKAGEAEADEAAAGEAVAEGEEAAEGDEAAEGEAGDSEEADEAEAAPAAAPKVEEISDQAWLARQIRALTPKERKPLDMAGIIRKQADGPIEFARPPKAGIFFSIYFFMTGLHGFHVLIGIGLWFWMLKIAGRREMGSKYYGPIEFTALYWHLVDLIWIYLFPMLYLIH